MRSFSDHFDRAFEHADKAFAEADKAFAEVDQYFAAEVLFNEMNRARAHHHHLRFTAKNWRERFRLLRRFCAMGFQVLTTGKTELQFKNNERAPKTDSAQNSRN